MLRLLCMCGRYVSPDTAAIERAWHIGRTNNNPLRRRYNVLPTTQIPVVRRARDADELELAGARWGLIPHWWSKPKAPTSTINARSEEAAGKPMWRYAYRHARCLIPALGWYEWKPIERTDAATGEVRTYKQPFYLRIDREGPVAFAGLMVVWTLQRGAPRLTCAILTRAPSPTAAEVHDRMPMILRGAAHRDWLDAEMKNAARVAEIIATAAIDEVKHYPVSIKLNTAKNDDETFIEPFADPLAYLARSRMRRRSRTPAPPPPPPRHCLTPRPVPPALAPERGFACLNEANAGIICHKAGCARRERPEEIV